MSTATTSSEVSLQKRLKAVSRSFYLTLRALPAQVRPQIGLAYLLARAGDTIADTDVLPVAERLETLSRFREALSARSPQALPPKSWSGKTATHGESRLMEELPVLIDSLGNFSKTDQERIETVLMRIISAQEMDLKRFHPPAGSCPEVIALETEADLDDYTYRIAGCVGEFWTTMIQAHLFPSTRLDTDALIRNGIDFGKGLQMVNILRDLPKDLRQGRCYLPSERLKTVGLKPNDLLDPSREADFRPLFDDYLDRTERLLEAGWEYTMSLPTSQRRARLACAWPLLIGFRTIALLKQSPVLSQARPVKITRKEVYHWMFQSMIRLPFPGLFNALATKARR